MGLTRRARPALLAAGLDRGIVGPVPTGKGCEVLRPPLGVPQGVLPELGQGEGQNTSPPAVPSCGHPAHPVAPGTMIGRPPLRQPDWAHDIPGEQV